VKPPRSPSPKRPIGATGNSLMPLAFLDTHVILRHLLGDHPDHSPRASALLERILTGEVRVRTAESVFFEVIFTLQRTHRVPREIVRDLLTPLLDSPSIVMSGKRRLLDALDTYVTRNISFLDAYHGVLMRDSGIVEVISFDRDLDRLDWVQRTEP
jgi:predicted nucleic acid-binding protein